MADISENIKQTYDVGGNEIYPKVVLDSIIAEDPEHPGQIISGTKVIQNAVKGIGMDGLVGVSVEYDKDGVHHLVFKSDCSSLAGTSETIVDEGPFVVGNFSESKAYANDIMYVSKKLVVAGSGNTLEFRDDVEGSSVVSLATSGNNLYAISSRGGFIFMAGGESSDEGVSIQNGYVRIPSNKEASIGGKATIGGPFNAQANVTLNSSTTNTTTIKGNTSIQGTATIDGSTTLNNTLSVKGKTVIKHDVSLYGDASTTGKGRSPMLEFNAIKNAGTDRKYARISKTYESSGASKLEIFDDSTANAKLSLIGSSKRFVAEMNGYDMLYLDGSAKIASIYADSDDKAYLSIDGANNTVYLKASETTYIELDDKNGQQDIAIMADNSTYLTLWGGDDEREVHLQASRTTRMDMNGNGGYTYLYGDSKRYLALDGEDKYVMLQADPSYYLKINDSDGVIEVFAGDTTRLIFDNEGGEHNVNLYADNSTYLNLYGGDAESVVLKAKDGMYLGMNDSSGYLTLQAKEGTYLGFDVSGNNKSVGLYANSTSYLTIDSSHAYLRADGTTKLEMDASNDSAYLFADSGSYFYTKKNYAIVRASSVAYCEVNDSSHTAKLYADGTTRLELDASSDTAKLYANGTSSLSIGLNSAKLQGAIDNYIDFSSEGNVTLQNRTGNRESIVLKNSDNTVTISAKSSAAKITVDGSNGLVKNSVQVQAKVNGWKDVYLGCPIGTVVMWSGTTTPEHWFLCDGTRILLQKDDSESYTQFAAQTIQGRTFTELQLQVFVNVIGHTYFSGYIAYDTSWGKYVKSHGTHSSGSWVLSSTNYTSDINKALILDSSTRKFYYTGVTSSLTEAPTTNMVVIGLPNMKAKFPLGAASDTSIGKNPSTGKGWNLRLGDTGGEDTHVLTSSEITRRSTTLSGSDVMALCDDMPPAAHNNTPPFLALNFIIKYE